MSWIEGRVIRNRRWTSRHCSLQVKAAVQPFQAGQFTRLALDIEGERIARPYSFINAPHEPLLEFYFNKVPGGVLSNQLSNLEEGDAVWVASQAAGFLILSEVPQAEHLWLFSVGTAIGPFLSMLKTEEPWQRFSRVTLVYGVRTVEELAYQDEIQLFQELHPETFTVVPSVTRQATDFALHDRIPHAIQTGELEARVGLALNPDQSQAMICGSPLMVQSTRRALELRGLKKHLRHNPGQISSEDYR